nr:STAS domain-containing protein [Gordonia sp. SID5947]
MVITFVATTQIPLQDAILVGAASSLVLYCVQAARAARLVSLTDSDGDWYVGDAPATLKPDSVTIVHYSGVALFAEVPRITEHWPRITDDSRRAVLILSVRTLPDVPSATMQKMLKAQADTLRANGGRFMLAGVSPVFMDRISKSGIAEIVGHENLFPATDQVFGALDDAYEEAVRWLDSRPSS